MSLLRRPDDHYRGQSPESLPWPHHDHATVSGTQLSFPPYLPLPAPPCTQHLPYPREHAVHEPDPRKCSTDITRGVGRSCPLAESAAYPWLHLLLCLDLSPNLRARAPGKRSLGVVTRSGEKPALPRVRLPSGKGRAVGSHWPKAWV